MLSVKLKYLDDWNASRASLARRYSRLVAELNESLAPEDQWVPPPLDEEQQQQQQQQEEEEEGGGGGDEGGAKEGAASASVSVWHLYVVRVRAGVRDALLKHLHENKIGAGIHYPIPISQLGAYKELAEMTPRLPRATGDAPRLLSLPLYPEMEEAQQDRVMAVARAFYAKQAHTAEGASA